MTTVEDISDAEYLMLAVTPEMMIGHEIDVTNDEDVEYAFYNMTNLGADDIDAVDPYGWADVCSAGKLKVEKTAESIKVTFSFTLLSGEKFEGSYEGSYTDIKQKYHQHFDSEWRKYT